MLMFGCFILFQIETVRLHFGLLEIAAIRRSPSRLENRQIIGTLA
jgi:hypothetical protein